MRSLSVSVLLFMLAACATPSTAPVNRDFSPPDAAEIASGFELRHRYDLPAPMGGTAIYVDSVAVHHLHREVSTIVWRDEAGNWRRSQAIEIGPGGLLRVERRLDSHEATSLTASQARSLERLIRNPRLYSGEVRRTGELGIGGPLHVMAIATPFGRTTVKWDGRLHGASGAVADIVLGRGDD
jgi:hypothetical protein